MEGYDKFICVWNSIILICKILISKEGVHNDSIAKCGEIK